MRKNAGTVSALALLGECIMFFATDANAQCSARDALRNHLTFRAPLAVTRPSAPIKSALDFAGWKTITTGTFQDSSALLDSLEASGCAVGDAAAQILARPAFQLSHVKAQVELFDVSVAELGFQADTVPLADIYARAQLLGFGLAAAEVAPQLRLQYADQPLGEFVIAMDPIKTWSGEPMILTVVNFGAGLMLMGRNGDANARIPIASHFLFVRPDEALAEKATHGRDQALALGRH